MFGQWVTYGLRRQRNKALAALFLAWPVAGQAEQVDILALGDSLTQGYGLLESDGLVPQLRGWLAARGHEVRVVNGGVSGDTTAGGLARVAWSLTPEIDAMIVALGGNDMLRGIAPEAVRENIDGILSVAAEQGIEVLLVGMTAPGNYGPDYKRAFDAVFPEAAQTYNTLYLPSFFAPLIEGDDAASMADFLQSDGIHPNALGVARIVEFVGPEVEALIGRVQAGR